MGYLNGGYVRPMSILRQCRNVLRQESSRSVVMGRPTNLIEIILCLLSTYTPSSSLIDLINTCVFDGGLITTTPCVDTGDCGSGACCG